MSPAEIAAELADTLPEMADRQSRREFLLGLLNLCREMIEDGEPTDRIADFLGLAQLVAISLRAMRH
jgi:hypothetical protein